MNLVSGRRVIHVQRKQTFSDRYELKKRFSYVEKAGVEVCAQCTVQRFV